MNVRRVALVAFNSAAHNKPSLVRDLLDSVLPKLYAETNIKVSLCSSLAATSYLPIFSNVQLFWLFVDTA